MKKYLVLFLFCISTALFADDETSLSQADIASLSESISIYLAVTRGERDYADLSEQEAARYDFVQELVSTERVSIEQLEAISSPRSIGKTAAAARLIELTRPETPYYWGVSYGLNNLNNGNLNINGTSAMFGLRLGSHLAQRRWFWETELNLYGSTSDSSLSTPSSTRTDLDENTLELKAIGASFGRRWQSNVFLSYLAEVGLNYMQMDAEASQTIIDSSDSSSGATSSDDISSNVLAPFLGISLELTEYNNFLIRVGIEYSSFSNSDNLNLNSGSTEIGSSSMTSLAFSVNMPL